MNYYLEIVHIFSSVLSINHPSCSLWWTAGVALSSSPQGLAAYIIEKFSSWTNMKNMYKKDGGLLDPDFPISLDAILDNICIYW